MKNYTRISFFTGIILLMFLMQGCDIIADIFGAGLWVGVILTVLVIVFIIWLISRIFRRR
jgi:ABC-type Fe3+-siderophore transport system permease subunit